MTEAIISVVAGDLTAEDRIHFAALRAKHSSLGNREFGMIFQAARDKLATEQGIVLVCHKGVYTRAVTKEQKEGKASRYRRKAARAHERCATALGSILTGNQLTTPERASVETRRNRAADLSLDARTRARRAERLKLP